MWTVTGKAKVIFCIVIANIFYRLCQPIHVRRALSLLCPIPQHAAEDPAEIFVAGIGEETPGIREHPDEIPQQSQVCKGR